tara:strand:+ start:1278 stop:1649 length:372 start_codon:yes stop_codon:yes gene_type:complete
MAISYELKITDRVQTANRVLADGEEAPDFIEAIVCVLTASETVGEGDSAVTYTASTDPWVSLSDPSTVERSDFVAFADMSSLPNKINSQLQAWGNDEDRRQQLANQIASQKVASVEKTATWAA